MICIVTEFTFVSFYLNVTTLRSGICYRKSVSLSSVTYVYLTNTRGLRAGVHNTRPRTGLLDPTESVSILTPVSH